MQGHAQFGTKRLSGTSERQMLRGGCWGAQQESWRVCCSAALHQHNAGGKTVLQKRGEHGACLFMGIEYLVARVRLREVSLVSESNTCWLKFCLQFHMDEIFTQYAII